MQQRDFLKELEQLKFVLDSGKYAVDYEQVKKLIEDIQFSQLQEVIQKIEQAMNDYTAGITNLLDTEITDER